jgi:hypothetical protein
MRGRLVDHLVAQFGQELCLHMRARARRAASVEHALQRQVRA